LFGNSNNVSFGFNAGTMTASVPSVSSLSVTGLLSISTNGSTISIGAPGTVQSVWVPGGGLMAMQQYGQGVMQINPVDANANYSASRLDLYASFSVSSASNSSYAGTISVSAGVYTRTGSTLALASSGGQTYSFSNTSNSYNSYLSAVGALSMPFNANFAEADYWVGVVSRTASSGANWLTGSNLVYSNVFGNFDGLFNAAPISSAQMVLGQGQYSAAVTALPLTIAFSQIVGTAASANQPPVMALHNVSA
jgi:hypothetical protein